MKPWIPYAVAAALGLGAAVAAFPDREGKASQAERAARRAERRAARAATQAAAVDPGAAPEESPVVVEPPEAQPANEAPAFFGGPTGPDAPIPPAAQPFARHVSLTAPYWAQLSKELAASDEVLSLEVVAIARYLRDQASNPSADPERAIGKQREVVARVRAKVDDPRIITLLDYLETSGEAARRGVDPGSIPTPRQDRPPR